MDSEGQCPPKLLCLSDRTTQITSGPWTHRGGNCSLLAKMLSKSENKRPTINIRLFRGDQRGETPSNIETFAYCLTGGYWRKQSRWGRPGGRLVLLHSWRTTALRSQQIFTAVLLKCHAMLRFGVPDKTRKKNVKINLYGWNTLEVFYNGHSKAKANGNQ